MWAWKVHQGCLLVRSLYTQGYQLPIFFYFSLYYTSLCKWVLQVSSICALCLQSVVLSFFKSCESRCCQEVKNAADDGFPFGQRHQQHSAALASERGRALVFAKMGLCGSSGVK